MDRTPLSVRLWFAWAVFLLLFVGLLLGRIIEFVDFSERAPFSLLGLFMMVQLAAVLFGITVAIQRKRIARPFAIGIAGLAIPNLAGLPPILLGMPGQTAVGWATLFVPIGALLTFGLIVGLMRGPARIYFSED